VIDYKAAARIHDTLVVHTAFTGMRGPRLNFRQRIERTGQMLAEAEIVAVAIHADGRARKPSATELAHWDAYNSITRNGP
jgi:acyl-CoA thioester hydrolase